MMVTKTDNDHKVGAVQTLEAELGSVQGQDVDAQALESIAALIKTSLRNGNSRVYTAGLACAVVFLNVADEQWQATHSEGHSTSHLDHIFKNAVHTLAVPPGGLLTFLGDAKDSVRASARAALLQAAKTSVAISASESRLPPDQMPLAMLDKLMKEQGFASKNAKVREQVRFLGCLYQNLSTAGSLTSVSLFGCRVFYTLPNYGQPVLHCHFEDGCPSSSMPLKIPIQSCEM